MKLKPHRSLIKFFVLKGGLEGLVKKMEKKIKQDSRVVIKKDCYASLK